MRRATAASRTVAILLVLGAGSIVSGCTNGPLDVPESLSALPDGVTVDVVQPRVDVALGRIAIRVRNGTDGALELTAAAFASPRYLDEMTWADAPSTVPPGAAIDLRMPLSAPDCTADADAGDDLVTLSFAVDGVTGDAQVVPGDPYDQFPALPRQACLAEHLAAIADVAPRLEEGADGTDLVLALTPTGDASAGEATIAAADGTTLVSYRGTASSARIDIGTTVAATDAPVEIRLPIAPTRCDPHAVAEDKVGALIPLELEIAGVTGRIQLPATDAFRDAVHAWVVATCGEG